MLISNIADFYKYAGLATAAYVRMGDQPEGMQTDGATFVQQAALQSRGRLPLSIGRFLFDSRFAVAGYPQWKIRHYYGSDHLADPIAAADDSGFAATLFQQGEAGEKVLAIRGTEPFEDGWVDLLSADLGQIGVLGIALSQTVSMVNLIERMRGSEGASVRQIHLSVLNDLPPLLPGTQYVRAEGVLGTSVYFVFSPGEASGLELIDPGEKITVTGHSLGGELAVLAALLFPGIVSPDVTVFNAAGINPDPAEYEEFQNAVLGTLMPAASPLISAGLALDLGLAAGLLSLEAQQLATPLLRALMGTLWGLPPDWDWNGRFDFSDSATAFPELTINYIRAEDLAPGDDFDLVASALSGADIYPAPTDIAAEPNSHVIEPLMDALALHASLYKMDSQLQLSDNETLLLAASREPNRSEEALTEAIFRLLLPDGKFLSGRNAQGDPEFSDVLKTSDAIGPIDNSFWIRKGDITARDAFHDAVLRVLAVLDEPGTYSVSNLTSLPEATIASIALAPLENNADQAYRYALVALNPFAVIGADYTRHNQNSELNLYDPQTRTGNLTQEAWIEDRAAMLYWNLLANTHDTDVVVRLGAPDLRFVDAPSKSAITVRGIGSGPPVNQVLSRVVFGSDAADGLAGASASDRLYGGLGTDVLQGKGGDDYLEGGRGLDLYEYGASRLTIAAEDGTTYNLTGNDGADTILDIDGHGLLRYGFRDNGQLTTTIIADASLKLGENLWESADGRFSYARQDSDLLITLNDSSGGRLLLKDFRDGDFFVRLRGEINTSNLQRIDGDLAPVDRNPSTPEIETTLDALGNVVTDSNSPQPGRNDVLYGHDGDSGADWIVAGAGRDRIVARGGGDLVEGGEGGTVDDEAGGDLIDGGAGDDWLWGDSRRGLAEAIRLGATEEPNGQKGDWLSGHAGHDVLAGSAGNDVLVGGAGADLLIGGAGNDSLGGDADWTQIRFGWTVEDYGTYQFFPGVSGEDHPLDDEGDTIYGGSGNDFAWGGRGDDLLFGEAGADRLYGQWGSDVLVGGAGNDVLYGDDDIPAAEHGADVLDGGDGDDRLYGNGGDDILIGGPGNDTMRGGAGKDTYVFSRGDGNEIVFDTPPTDPDNKAERSVVVITDDSIRKEDVIFRPGSLMIDFGLADPDDPDSVHDAIHFEGFSAQNPWATPVVGEIRFADGSVMTFEDILDQGFDIDGTRFDDDGIANPVLLGTAVTDRIRGFAGNDVLAGGAGDDTLDGGAGEDTLYGGDGDDVLLGGEGADLLFGEAGGDTLRGGEGDDLLRGDNSFDVLAEQGDDELFGDAGNDQLLGYGGNDALDGGEGDDVLEGGEGADVLTGGAGADELFGGRGADTYVFSAGHGADVITEYGEESVSLDIVAFTEEIAPQAIQVRREGNDLTLTAIGGADSVRVAGYFSAGLSGAGIERVRFADGTVWDAAALRERLTWGGDADDIIVGTEDAEVLRGFAGNDSLDGAGGDDRLEGGLGLDAYVLGWHGGTDTVIDDPAESSIVQLGEGMLVSDLGMTRSGDDLHLSVLDTTSELVLPGYYAQSGNWTVRSATGAQQTLADVLVEIQARAAVATVAQAEQAFIDSARRRFLAELASFGGRGDIRLYTQESDAATIYRQSSQYAGSPAYYILPIERITGGASDNFFDLRYSGVMTVDGGAGDDFIYSYGWGDEGIGSFLYGNAGHDTIVGSFDDDVLHDGAGVNYLAGIEGDDTYLLLASDTGTNLIDESVPKLILQGGHYSFGGAPFSSDTLAFGTGIAADALLLSWGTLDIDGIAPGNDHDSVYATLNIGYGNGATARVVLPASADRDKGDGWWGIEAVTFADGTRMTFAQLLALAPPEPAIEQNLDNVLQGTAGADVIYGYAGNDVLLGFDGADTLYGGDGFDVIDGGSGNDLLSDSSVPNGGGNSGNNLFLGGAGDDVIRPNETNSGSTFPANLIIGGAGQDAIEIEWLGSNNWIVAFNRGDGVDTIANPYGQFYWNGTLSLGGGITAGEVSAQVIGTDLFIGTGGGEGIRLQRWAVPYDHNWENLRLQIVSTGSINTYDLTAFALGGGSLGNYLLSSSSTMAMGGAIAYRYAVEGSTDSLGAESIALVLSDASFGTAEQSIFPTLIGTEANDFLTGTDAADKMYGRGGNDSLAGLAGDDILDGGAGNDWLSGDEGNDTYIYGSGYGQDHVYEFNIGFGGLDRIQLTDLTPAQVAVTRVMLESRPGELLQLLDESFYLQVIGSADWLNFRASDVESIEFADGTRWDEAAVRAQVQVTPATAFADLIGGSSGDDRIDALGGNDELHGNEGDDHLSGGDGDDIVEGGKGNDLLFGGAGNDDLQDYLGSSFIDGGAGEDYIFSEGGPVLVAGGAGDDYLDMYDADAVVAVFNAGHGEDILWLPEGPMVFSLGADISMGALALRMQGNDLVFETSATDSVRLNPGWGVQGAQGLRIQTFGDTGVGDRVQAYDFSAVIGAFDARRLQDPAVTRWVFGDNLSDYLLSESAVEALGGDLAYQYANYGDAAGLGDESLRAVVNDPTFVFAPQEFTRTGRVFEAPAGGGTLTGGPGDDTYHVRLGSGVTTIIDRAGAGAGNQLIFGPAITPAMLSLGVGSLLIRVGEGGEVVHLASFDPNDVYGVRTIEQFRFENGITLSYEDLLDRGFDIYGSGGVDLLTGTSIADRISGGAGEDTLDGLAGDDLLSGEAGADLYLFGRGSATDRIVESGLAGEIDAVLIAEGLTAGEITLTRAGANLILGIAGTADTLSIENWLDPAARVEEIRFADGTVWGEATLHQLFNRSPVYAGTLTDQTAPEDLAFSYTVPAGAFVDPDVNDLLVFSAAGDNGAALPGWLYFDPVAQAFSGTPGNADVGSFTVNLTATDPKGLAASGSFTVTVANTNDLPRANFVLDALHTSEDQPFAFMLPAGLFEDEDVGDILAISVTGEDGAALPGWLSFDAAAASLGGIPGNADVGSYLLEVTATDLAGAQAQAALSLTVANVNDAPVAIAALAGVSIAEERSVVIALPQPLFVDVDAGDRLSFSARLAGGASLPVWLAFDAGQFGFVAMPGLDDQGDYLVEIEARDLAGATATVAMRIEVINVNTVYGSSDPDTMQLGRDFDIVHAGNGDDVVRAGAGDDVVFGDNGNDRLEGETGNDWLSGGRGNDTLAGGGGRDVLVGDEGNDVLTGSLSRSFIAGGKGNDVLHSAGEATVVALNAQEGNDRLLGLNRTGVSQGVTVSLGAGLSGAPLSLRRSGADLTLDTGRDSSLTFADWYGAGARSDFTLQSIAASSADPAGEIRRFDFDAWVADFDAAQASGGSFDPAASLTAHEQTVAPGAVVGGEMAWRYAIEGSLAAMDAQALQAVLAEPGFAAQPQPVHADAVAYPGAEAQSAAPLSSAPAPAKPMATPNTATDENTGAYRNDDTGAARGAGAHSALSEWYAGASGPVRPRIDLSLPDFSGSGEADTRRRADDAWWLERQWRETHRRLQAAASPGEDGVASGFAIASLRLDLPQDAPGLGRFETQSAAHAGLQTFRGLSDGFSVLG